MAVPFSTAVLSFRWAAVIPTATMASIATIYPSRLLMDQAYSA